MKQLTKILITSIVLLGIGSVTLSADVDKGQRLYLKKLKYACGMNGAAMADRHSVAEWEEIYNKGDLAKELRSVCPKIKDDDLKEKFLPHYFDFFKMYGNDSGNVPAC